MSSTAGNIQKQLTQEEYAESNKLGKPPMEMLNGLRREFTTIQEI